MSATGAQATTIGSLSSALVLSPAECRSTHGPAAAAQVDCQREWQRPPTRQKAPTEEPSKPATCQPSILSKWPRVSFVGS